MKESDMNDLDVIMDVSYVDGLKFVTNTGSGMKIFTEPGPALGGNGTKPNPMEYFISSLGSCTAIKLLIQLRKIGMNQDSISMKIEGTRRSAPPELFEKIHYIFFLEGNLDEGDITIILQYDDPPSGS